jgi:hypothetical protein
VRSLGAIGSKSKLCSVMSVQGHLDQTKSRHLTVKVDRVLEMASLFYFTNSKLVLALQAESRCAKNQRTNRDFT